MSGYDRWYLLGDKRNETLALRQVEQYGRDSFGDPHYVSIYGLTPHEWYARGVRIHDSYDHRLAALGEPGEDLLIVFVAPPWGHALSEGSGLDLRRTEPPVAEVVDVTTTLLGRHKLLFAVQVYETVEPASLAGLTARFPWSALKAYDINESGYNHGLLLATWGWTPSTDRHGRGARGSAPCPGPHSPGPGR